MIILIGISCLFMAFVLAFTDPMQFNPDPFLQSIVWVCFAIWCFVTAWKQRNWHPQADTENNIQHLTNSAAPLSNKALSDSTVSLRNPLAALAAVNENLAKSEDDEQNRDYRLKEAQRLRDLAREQPLANSLPESEISTRQALLAPLDDIHDLDQLRAIAKKLQAMGAVDDQS